MAMGRVKTGPNGLYYDPNDSGPDQGGSQEAEDFRAQNGLSNTTGINGGGGAQQAVQTDPAGNTDPPVKPTPGMTREQWRDAWMSSGQKSAADTDAWLLANGATKVADNGTFRTPQGEILDLGIGYKSGGMVTPGWTRTDGGGNDGGSGTGSGSGSVKGAGATRNSLMDYLMGRVNQSLAINRNDPVIRQQADAFDAQGQKARRDFLGDVAEQNGPYNSGALMGQARMSAEALGKSVGSFEATLMQKELDARRLEIQNALNGAIGMISEQERNDLTRELGRLDNALAYARLNQDAYQFDINDEFRRSPLATPN